nr:hypothetical protein [Tanacetum cinerariifolium]
MSMSVKKSPSSQDYKNHDDVEVMMQRASLALLREGSSRLDSDVRADLVLDYMGHEMEYYLWTDSHGFPLSGSLPWTWLRFSPCGHVPRRPLVFANHRDRLFASICAVYSEREEVVQGKDKEIAELRAHLEKLKRFATEVFRLRGRVSELETATAVRVEKLAGLEAKNVELTGQFSDLEILRDELKELESMYLAVVKDLEDIPFLLLEDLEAFKDSPIELLMASLTLDGSHGEEDQTLEFRWLQPVMKQLTVLATSRDKGDKNKDTSLNLVVAEPFMVASGSHFSSLAPTVQALMVNTSMTSTNPILALESSLVGPGVVEDGSSFMVARASECSYCCDRLSDFGCKCFWE